MDLRIKKTRQAIKTAFLKLLSVKTLEQITVKELCQTAQISKGTFYLHYHDLFDLCDQLQRETIRKVLSHITDPMQIVGDLAGSLEKLQHVMDAEPDCASPLFSGAQRLMFPALLEQELKKSIFELYPQYREDLQLNVDLSYHIFGGYYSYMENQARFGHEPVLRMIRQTRHSTVNGSSTQLNQWPDNQAATGDAANIP